MDFNLALNQIPFANNFGLADVFVGPRLLLTRPSDNLNAVPKLIRTLFVKSEAASGCKEPVSAAGVPRADLN